MANVADASKLRQQLEDQVITELKRRKVSKKVLESAKGDDYTLLHYSKMSISQMADFEIENA